MFSETEEARADTYCPLKIYTLKTKKHFQLLRSQGIRNSNGTVLQTKNNEFLYAISISRKICCAVLRNRIKRRIRAGLRDISLPSAMVIFKPKKELAYVSFLEIQQYIIQTCRNTDNALK